MMILEYQCMLTKNLIYYFVLLNRIMNGFYYYFPNSQLMHSPQIFHPLPQQSLQQRRRRRRVPSKYAQDIKQHTKMSVKGSKREKKADINEPSSQSQKYCGEVDEDCVSCILPGKTKKIRLSIIIKKSPKLKQRKAPTVIVKQQEKEKVKEKQTPKNKSLLHTLLEVCEQLQQDENQNKNDIQNKINGIQTENNRREARLRREREEEEKYLRYYERYKLLNEKFDQRLTDLVMI